MILSYGFSIPGLSHREKDLPCQDAHYIGRLANGWVVAAVADGVGSSAHAEEAAALAVAAVADMDGSCLSGLAPWDGQAAEALLRDGFDRAEKAIGEAASTKGAPIGAYYTTLTAVVYDGQHLAFGHCGDGGVVGLAVDGAYHMVTQVQKGEEFNTVKPLNHGQEHWAFASPQEAYCSLLLMTDGLYDAAAPALLHGDEASGGMYIRFLRQFMDAGALGITAENRDGIEDAVKAYFEEGPSPEVTDDKTMVCLINGGCAPPAREDAYYAEPDWEALRARQNERLYPAKADPGLHSIPGEEGDNEHERIHRT